MIASRRPIRLSFTAARNQSGMSLLEIIIVIVLIGAVLMCVVFLQRAISLWVLAGRLGAKA